MKFGRQIRTISFALLALVILATPAFSQSCSLCYTQAASAGARMIQALRSGILILIIPPTLGTAFVLYVAYRKRNQFAAPSGMNKADRW
jgi:hypothetical protein